MKGSPGKTAQTDYHLRFMLLSRDSAALQADDRLSGIVNGKQSHGNRTAGSRRVCTSLTDVQAQI
ncbi:MAG: hypothetical protein MK110_15385 [Fuerstiella sp.]|nr:hypothetical protein [Fuerstiella sp.]